MRRIVAGAGVTAMLVLSAIPGLGRGIVLPAIGPGAGISGAIRALFVTPSEAAKFEPRDDPRPGVHPLAGAPGFEEIVLTPFSAKSRGRIGSYFLGQWPFEGRTDENPSYADPAGFVMVTPETASLHVSRHFTLGEFLTKNQPGIWPKYLVLQPRLLDKLELTIAELHRMGYPVPNLHVMSGFRTPAYNALDLGPKARARLSRHMYGDAADVYPDGGVPGDVNGDGRVDLSDARILARAAEEVEREHPELVGGIGIYPATKAHPPFVHIDVRGWRARWSG